MHAQLILQQYMNSRAHVHANDDEFNYNLINFRYNFIIIIYYVLY